MLNSYIKLNAETVILLALWGMCVRVGGGDVCVCES